MIIGRIAQIETMGMVDGPGIRTVIFLQGCPLRCIFCHNPEMWNKDGGKEYTPKEVLDIVLKYRNYYGDNGGVTFSGGEPLFQSKFLIECLKLCKKNNIHTCIDTSGVGDSTYFDEILKYTDLVLFSVKALNSNEYKNITSGNINSSLLFLDACQKSNIPLWIRNVIIPNINDNIEHIRKLVSFIKPINNVQKIELLPYHTMSKDKYKRLNIDYSLKDTQPMDVSRCKELEKELNELCDLTT
jgi:pyruvate formate lyase activating enzyme